MRLRSVAMALVLVFAATGCATAPERAARFQEPGAAPRGAVVDYDFLPDPARVAPRLAAGQEFLPPRPLVTPLPEYPAGEEAAAKAPVAVVVRIVVGKDGLVGEAAKSPLAAAPGTGETGGRDTGDAAFLQAAEDAVRRWQFVPAEIQSVQPGEDLDGDSKPDYTVLVQTTPVPVYLDVRFLFEMIAGVESVRIESVPGRR